MFFKVLIGLDPANLKLFLHLCTQTKPAVALRWLLPLSVLCAMWFRKAWLYPLLFGMLLLLFSLVLLILRILFCCLLDVFLLILLPESESCWCDLSFSGLCSVETTTRFATILLFWINFESEHVNLKPLENCLKMKWHKQQGLFIHFPFLCFYDHLSKILWLLTFSTWPCSQDDTVSYSYPETLSVKQHRFSCGNHVSSYAFTTCSNTRSLKHNLRFMFNRLDQKLLMWLKRAHVIPSMIHIHSENPFTQNSFKWGTVWFGAVFTHFDMWGS